MSDTTAVNPEQAPVTNLLPSTGPLEKVTEKTIRLKDLPADDQIICPLPTSDLISSMRNMGLLQRIGLVMTRDGGYTVAFGRRRIKAARKLGWDTINATVYPLGWANAASMTLQENSTRKDNPIMEYHAIEQLIKERHSAKSISETLGLPMATIEKRLVLRKLPEELMVALNKNQIKYGVAEAVAKLPAAQQAEAVTMFSKDGKLKSDEVAELKRVNTREAQAAATKSIFTEEELAGQAVAEVRNHAAAALETIQRAPAGTFVPALLEATLAMLALVDEKPATEPEAPMVTAEATEGTELGPVDETDPYADPTP